MQLRHGPPFSVVHMAASCGARTMRERRSSMMLSFGLGCATSNGGMDDTEAGTSARATHHRPPARRVTRHDDAVRKDARQAMHDRWTDLEWETLRASQSGCKQRPINILCRFQAANSRMRSSSSAGSLFPGAQGMRRLTSEAMD